MSGFDKVDLGNYEAYVAINGFKRTIIIVSESKEAAQKQAVEFAKHLHEKEGLVFDETLAIEAYKLNSHYVTYTEAAWETLKASS
jgi:hypothetical protein